MHSHLVSSLLSSWVLCTSLMSQCSHLPHRQCLERCLAHSYWMPASHSNGPPTCTLRHPASWALLKPSLAHCGPLDPNHILYGLLSGSSDTRQVRLRSRRPCVSAARNLLDNLARLGIRASEWTNHKWKTKYCENASRLHAFVPESSARLVGMGLPQAAWVKFNCLLTGVGQFHSSMHEWGLAPSLNCECGISEETTDYVLTVCLIYQALHGAQGLTVLDDETRCWLNNTTASIWFRQFSSLG